MTSPAIPACSRKRPRNITWRSRFRPTSRRCWKGTNSGRRTRSAFHELILVSLKLPTCFKAPQKRKAERGEYGDSGETQRSFDSDARLHGAYSFSDIYENYQPIYCDISLHSCPSPVCLRGRAGDAARGDGPRSHNLHFARPQLRQAGTD